MNNSRDNTLHNDTLISALDHNTIFLDNEETFEKVKERPNLLETQSGERVQITEENAEDHTVSIEQSCRSDIEETTEDLQWIEYKPPVAKVIWANLVKANIQNSSETSSEDVEEVQMNQEQVKERRESC